MHAAPHLLRCIPARLISTAFLILKLVIYSSGFDGSKVLPITTKVLVVAVGGVRPTSFISLRGVGREEHLLGDTGIIDVALDLAPALHLGENPDRERLPRERIEIDAVRHLLHIAETVGEGAGQHLLDHRHRLVEIIRRRDRFGDLLAVLRLGREGGRVDDRLQQRRIGVRRTGDEFLRGREGAAGMPVPDILRQDVDEADAVIDRALVHRIGREEAVDIVGAQVGDHFRRRHRADLDVAVGIEAVLGEVIAQQIIVHRIVERHRELHALPGLRIALVLVLDRQRDRLAVDVLHRRHRVGDRVRAGAHRDRERHRRQHVRRVVFLVEVLSRITAQPAVLITSTLRPCFE